MVAHHHRRQQLDELIIKLPARPTSPGPACSRNYGNMHLGGARAKNERGLFALFSSHAGPCLVKLLPRTQASQGRATAFGHKLSSVCPCVPGALPAMPALRGPRKARAARRRRLPIMRADYRMAAGLLQSSLTLAWPANGYDLPRPVTDDLCLVETSMDGVPLVPRVVLSWAWGALV